MTIERTQNGALRYTAIIAGQMVYRVYAGATVSEATKAFKAYCKALQNEQKTN